MKRYLPLIALGVGAWLAFVISSFPAATALRWFAPDVVRTSNVSGTIWSGTAQLASVDQLALRNLQWNIDALPLLLARLSGTAQAALPSGFANSRFRVAGNDVLLTDVQLSTSIAMLADALPVSGANGGISAQLEELALENEWPVSATGSVRISDLIVESLFTSELIPLGSFELTLAPAEGGGVAGEIVDLGGPLEVAATLSLTPAREYSIVGQVRERPSASQTLVESLGFMTGPPSADGFRELVQTGSL